VSSADRKAVGLVGRELGKKNTDLEGTRPGGGANHQAQAHSVLLLRARRTCL